MTDAANTPTDRVDAAWRRYCQAEAALRPLERDLVAALLARVAATVRTAYPDADQIETEYCTAALARVRARGRYLPASDEVAAAVAFDLTALSRFHALPIGQPLDLPAAPPEPGRVMTARTAGVDLATMTDEELALLHTTVREEDRARLGRGLRELVTDAVDDAVGVLVQRWEAQGDYGWEITRVYLPSADGEACDDVPAASLGDEFNAQANRLVAMLWDLEGSSARPGAATWVNDRIPAETVLTFFTIGRPT